MPRTHFYKNKKKVSRKFIHLRSTGLWSCLKMLNDIFISYKSQLFEKENNQQETMPGLSLSLYLPLNHLWPSCERNDRQTKSKECKKMWGKKLFSSFVRHVWNLSGFYCVSQVLALKYCMKKNHLKSFRNVYSVYAFCLSVWICLV